MRPLVMFPNAVRVAGEYLKDQMPSETVVRNVPNPRPARFVLIRRVGGVRQTLVSDAATLTVEAWAENDVAAELLCEEARMWLLAMPGHVFDGDRPVYAVREVGGPARLPDPRSDQARYVFTASVQLRGRSYSPDSSE